MGIFEGRSARASALVLLLASAACRHGTAAAPSTPKPTAERTVPAGDVYVALRSGKQPVDTTAALVAGTPRHVLLRSADPENVIVADVFFGAGAFQAPAGTPVRITLRPQPGRIGLVLETDSPFAAGAELTFKYAVDLQVPPEATTRYPNHVVFGRALVIGRIGADGQITLLASSQPASDNLRAQAALPGTYLVAAPK